MTKQEVNTSVIYEVQKADYLKGNRHLTVGSNPALPQIIAGTWSWQIYSVAFESEGKLIAFFTAVNTGNTWVSLPHFSYSSWWINYTLLKEIMLADNLVVASYEDCLSNFYNRFVNLLPDPSVQTRSEIVNIQLQYDELFSPVTINKHSAKLLSKDFIPLALHFNTSKVISLLELQQDMILQLAEFSSNIRRKIKKARSNGISIITGGAELLPQFYSVYRKNIHKHGSFGLPVRFFQNLLSGYRFGTVKVFLAQFQGKVIGCSLMLTYLGFAENPVFATNEKDNHLYVSYALHEAMIQEAIISNCHIYSFGHSTADSSVHFYKKQYGTRDQVLYINTGHDFISLAVRFSFLPPLISRLPQPLVRLFDEFVSQKVY